MDRGTASRTRRAFVFALQSSNLLSRALHALAASLILCWLPLAPAVADQPAYYAGLAYLGDFEFVDQNYPLSRALNEDRALAIALADEIRAIEPGHLELRFGLGDLNRDETVVLAVALDRERVSREVFRFSQGLRTKLIVEVALQVLLYDVAEGVLIDNLPVSAAYNHVMEGDVSDIDAEAQRLAQALYFGEDDAPGLLARAATVVAAYTPRPRGGLRFQLADVDVHDRVLPRLPDGLPQRRMQQRLGQGFSARLAEQTGVRVIPYTRGYAVGNQLPGRFANGEAFSLSLPEPDYAFHVELKNLTRNEVDGELVFGAQVRFRFEEPFTGTVVIDNDYRRGIYKFAAKRRVSADDWSAYEDAAESLLDDLVDQLRTPKPDWHREHARDAGTSYQQFQAKKDLFNES